MDIPLELDPKSARPLYRQLYDSLKTGIEEGRFAAGTRLPASRSLARSAGVSRITVTECYEQLLSEGYLETRRGSGTFVCRQLPEVSLRVSASKAMRTSDKEVVPRFSRYGKAVNVSLRRPSAANMLYLDRHGPDVAHFPQKVWARLVARRLHAADPQMYDYSMDLGCDRELRDLVVQYLAQARAVSCDPDQIIIVSGSQQAIDLTARILLDKGDGVAMESPGYYFAGRIFTSQSARLVPIAVDKQGLRVSDLKKERDIRLVYVTPSHQFPTGAALSLSRRKALIAWARDHDAYILEDDYDSEFRYRERPLPALQGISPQAPVIYTGSFSKLLFPSLRLGYMVLPKALFSAFRTAKVLTDMESSPFHQKVLADFLKGGHLESHLRRMRTLYERRRTVLIDALRRHFGQSVQITGDEAGMYLLATFRSHLSEEQAWDRALQAGVRLERIYWPGGTAPSSPGRLQFLFAYARYSEKELQTAAHRVAAAFLT